MASASAGSPAGRCGWTAPTPSSATPGGTLTIRLYATLRNLLGPHHHPDGEVPYVSPLEFAPVFAPGLDLNAPNCAGVIGEWGRTGVAPEDWDPTFCVVGFGDLGEVRFEVG